MNREEKGDAKATPKQSKHDAEVTHLKVTLGDMIRAKKGRRAEDEGLESR